MDTFRAEDIARQHQRFGGKMVIAQSVFSRQQRQLIKESLGYNVIFIILSISSELQIDRIKSRHGQVVTDEYIDSLLKFGQLCEKAGEIEENAFDITVTGNISKEDLADKIVSLVNEVGQVARKEQ